jgi:hypothetical protein
VDVPFFPLTTLCTKRTSHLSICQTRQDCICRNRRLIFHLSPAFGCFPAPRRHTTLSADSGTAACLLTSQSVASKSCSLRRSSPRSRRNPAASGRLRCVVAVVVDTHRFVSLLSLFRRPRSPLHKSQLRLWRFDSALEWTSRSRALAPQTLVFRVLFRETDTRAFKPHFERAVTCLRAHLQLHLPTLCYLILHSQLRASRAATSESRLLSAVALGHLTSSHSRHAWTRPIDKQHRQCRAMPRRTTVRDETDHAHHLVLPTDVLQ